jgi:hypothetical protein
MGWNPGGIQERDAIPEPPIAKNTSLLHHAFTEERSPQKHRRQHTINGVGTLQFLHRRLHLPER